MQKEEDQKKKKKIMNYVMQLKIIIKIKNWIY